MTTTPNAGTHDPEQGPSSAADEQRVDQDPGVGQGLGEAGATDDDARELGVTAAVERGPAELSSEGDPVPGHPHISLDGREPARSTDDLPSSSER